MAAEYVAGGWSPDAGGSIPAFAAAGKRGMTRLSALAEEDTVMSAAFAWDLTD